MPRFDWLSGRILVTLILIMGFVAVVRPFGPGLAATPANHSVGIWQRVIDDRKAAIAANPGDAESTFWLAVAYANVGRIRESSDTFGQLKQSDTPSPLASRISASTARQLEHNPNDLVALNGLAFASYADAKYDQAALEFRRIVEVDPDNPWVRAYYGFSLGKAGRIDEAIRVLQTGIALFPDNLHLHFLLGLAYYNKGMLVKAVQEMARARSVIRDFR